MKFETILSAFEWAAMESQRSLDTDHDSDGNLYDTDGALYARRVRQAKKFRERLLAMWEWEELGFWVAGEVADLILGTAKKIKAERNDLRVENARLKDFATGYGMVSEADSMEEAAVLVCGLHGRVDNLQAVLEQVEWFDTTLPDYPGEYCPWCGEDRHDGHASDCSRQGGLSRAENSLREDRAHWMTKCAGLEVENAKLRAESEAIGALSDHITESAFKIKAENARLMRALDDIAGVAYNYDGYDSASDLKKLIDELYVAARRALDGKEGFDVMEDKDV
jgi:hypothetical protein